MSLWLATTAIVLLVTVLLTSAYDGKATITINQKRLRTTAIAVGILFLATVAINIYNTIRQT